MGNTRYKLMAISDTHLGEDCSLLSFPQGRWHLWETLRRKLGGEGKFSVDELVLVGDIPDRCLSSTAQIVSQTNDFTEMLGSVANFNKVVYLIGNHDHSIWTKYRERRFGAGQEYGVSPPEGFVMIREGDLVPERYELETLTLLFGYDKGSSWRALLNRVEKKLPLPVISIAYPLYVIALRERAYVFSHGAHFCRIAEWLDYLNDFPGDLFKNGQDALNRIIGRTKPYETINDLEADLGPTMDAVWPSSRNEPTPWIDKAYYVLCKMTGKFEHKRPSPLESERIQWDDLPKTMTDQVGRLTDPHHQPTNDSSERFRSHFWPIAREFIRDKIKGMPVTFVHGHTHQGGWGQLFDDEKRDIRIYDLGGWVVHNRDHHPACHILVVDEDDQEFLLDVSFRDALIDEESLLDLARKDAENRL
jgi:hypothetical protein